MISPASGTQGLKCEVLRTCALFASWFGSAHLGVLLHSWSQPPGSPATFKPTEREGVSLLGSLL